MSGARTCGTLSQRFRWSSFAVLGLAATLTACEPAMKPVKPVDVSTLLDEGRREGLTLQDPLALDPQIEAEVAKKVGFVGTQAVRTLRIIRFLNDRSTLGFHYDANLTLTAREAYYARRGDCLSYTNLFLAIARYLKIAAYFVHVSEARNFYERDGIFFVSSHMAVGYGGTYTPGRVEPYTAIVDFTQESSDWPLMLYESVDDARAFGLFYNNIAVESMMSGDMVHAEKLLRFLAEKDPGLKEVVNNLGVLYMRMGDYEKALQTLQRAMKTFPAYQPLYTNAIQAARGCQEPEVAAELEARGQALMGNDPFFLFNAGVERFDKKDFAGAAANFSKALKTYPNNPFLNAWLARAYLTGGETEQGVKAFAKAQHLAPNQRMLAQLRQEFPALAAVPAPELPPAP